MARGGQLRLREPDGTELPSALPASTGSRRALSSSNEERGICLHPDALRGDGEPFDLGLTIDALLGVAARALGPRSSSSSGGADCPASTSGGGMIIMAPRWLVRGHETPGRFYVLDLT